MRVSANPPLRIRRAGPADLDALVALEEASFAHDRLSRAQYRRHLSSRSVWVIVAMQARRLVGVAVVFFRRGTHVARLYSLATAADARGRGVGGALLQAAARAARQRGCRALRLEVRVDNRVAVALYERVGYVRIGRRGGYYEDGTDAWRYEKSLRGGS